MNLLRLHIRDIRTYVYLLCKWKYKLPEIELMTFIFGNQKASASRDCAKVTASKCEYNKDSLLPQLSLLYNILKYVR